MPQHYQLSRLRLNLGPSTTTLAEYAKYLLRILVLLKFVWVSNGIHTNAYSFFFLKKRKQRFKIKLRTLKIFDTVGPSIRTKKYIIINTINF